MRRMFADVDADIYVMADGDATYDAASAPGADRARCWTSSLDMVVGARITQVEAAYRRGHRLGNRAADRHPARSCSGAASLIFFRATASSPGAL